jgi:hypothetical protein
MTDGVESLWGCDRAPAPFLEGYPRLKASELADELRGGRGRLTWIWRSDGAPFARADCIHPKDGFVQVTLETALANGSTEGRIVAQVRPGPNDAGVRPFSLFLCPLCERTTMHLVYAFRWSCDRCSGLKYRSQRVGAKVQAWERRDKLERLIGRGRPVGMHRTTLAKHRAELARLRAELGSDRAEAPAEWLYTLERKWSAAPANPPGGVDDPEERVVASFSPASPLMNLGDHAFGPADESYWMGD